MQRTTFSAHLNFMRARALKYVEESTTKNTRLKLHILRAGVL